jgi:hypothetical protein
MNNGIRCSNCGAEVSLTNAVCRYCKSPIKPESVLRDADREKIADVVSAMEETLKVASGNSWFTGVAFLFFSILALGSFFLYSAVLSPGITAWVLTIFTALTFFITFGAVVEFTERKAVGKAYREDVKVRIDEYLRTMNFHRYDFDGVADDLLPKKALLRRFLFMP